MSLAHWFSRRVLRLFAPLRFASLCSVFTYLQLSAISRTFTGAYFFPVTNFNFYIFIRSTSLHDCDVRFCLKKYIFILSFSANVTYSFRICIFSFRIYDDVRDIVETLVRKQRADRGCRLYHIFISSYWKSRSNEKSLSEKSQIVWARFWDITSQRQKETYSKKKLPPSAAAAANYTNDVIAEK